MKRWVLILLALLIPSLLAAGDEFIPGDSRINERDILDRMARELGEQPAAKQKALEPQEKKKAQEGPVDVFEISIVLSGGERVIGKAVFSQPALVLRVPGDKNSRIAVPLTQIKSLTIEKWKLVKKGNLAGRFYFVPSKCTVQRRDGTTASGIPDTQDIMQINLSGGRAFRSYYTAEQQTAELPSTTVVSIEFSKDNATAGLSD